MKEYQRQDGVMYLYDGDEKHVLVFPLIPKKEEFYNYKKSELANIPEDRRLLKAIATSRNNVLNRTFTQEEPLQTRKTKIKSSELSFGSEHLNTLYDAPYHNVIFMPLKGDSTDKLIEDYYNKLGASNYVEVINDKCKPEDIKGLILGNGFYELDNRGKLIKTDIINIPTSLLRLEQFMDGCFEGIDDEQIKEYLKLYEQVDINNPIYVKELSDVDEMAKYFPQTVILRPKIEQGIKNDAKVLSLLKKRR